MIPYSYKALVSTDARFNKSLFKCDKKKKEMVVILKGIILPVQVINNNR